MKVTELEGKDAYLLLFGGGVLSALIVLASIFLGHVITQRSNVPTVVQVQPAVSTPTVSVKLPEAPAPVVNVAPATAAVEVHVPKPEAVVNVTTPQPLVVFRPEDKKNDKGGTTPIMTPVISPPVPPAEKLEQQPQPVKSTSESKEKEDLEQALAAPSMDAVYKYAEFYLAHYCSKRGLDPHVEAQKWKATWESRLTESGNAEKSEQTILNEVCIQKRSSFQLETATPDQIAEGCRLLLRYRDQKLALLTEMEKAATPDNLRKTISLLATVSTK